jgi:hypothetical protein
MQNWTIDWSVVKAVIETLESIAVLVASIFAALGFNQWRKEIIGKRKIELAEEIVDIFSRLPNVIMNIRKPITFSDEGHSQVTDSQSPNLGHIVFERLAKHDEFFCHVDSIRYRFLAYFGNDKDKHFEDIRVVLGEIRSAAYMLKHDSQTDPMNDDLRKKCEKVVRWEYNGCEDELAQKVEQAKTEILQVCLPLLHSSVG